MADTGFAVALRSIRGRRQLSQLELAIRVETTQRHLSFLERGRSAPGRAMVVRLAEALELPLRERNDLLELAGYSPVYPTSPLDDGVLRPVIAALQHILVGHLPCPAIVVDRYGDLVAANDALAILTEGARADLRQPGMNVYRLALHPAGMAPRIANRAEWTGHILNRLRQEARRNPDPRLQSLLAELTEYAVTLAPGQPRTGLGFAVPLQLSSRSGPLRLITTVTSFATATDVTIAELKLEAFLPADESTAAALRRAGAAPS